MAGKPRYIYFNARARGELPRLVCAAGGIDFVDERIESANWGPDLKNKTPYGQLPVLEVDGKLYAQKLAISLYFARLCGLYPDSANELDLLKLWHALLFTEEVLENYVAARVDNQYFNKPETLEKVKNETFPLKLPMIERLLKENGTGYFVGNQMTIVDLSAFDIFEHVVDEMGKDYLNSYPHIKAHFEKISQLESIKKYINNRPYTTYTW